MGAAEVRYLGVKAAARALGIGVADARRWLEARGLIRRLQIPRPDGTIRIVERVSAAELEAEITGQRREAPVPAPRPPRGRLPYSNPLE